MLERERAVAKDELNQGERLWNNRTDYHAEVLIHLSRHIERVLFAEL
jgi:hypothetical protein